MQHLADLGEVYFTGIMKRASQKAGSVVGYQYTKGAWWWLLGVDGN